MPPIIQYSVELHFSMYYRIKENEENVPATYHICIKSTVNIE